MVNCSQTLPASNGGEETAALDMRPGGMIVQKRDDGVSGPTSATVTLKLSYGSQQLELSVPSDSTFGQVKAIIAHVIGVDPKVQKLLFRGKEKEDEEYLSMAGIKDNSKVILMEETTSVEKKFEEAEEKSETSRGGEAIERESEEVNSEASRGSEALEKFTEEVEVKSEASRGCEAVAVVRAEVDKLSDQVDALHVVINGGTKVDEKDIVYLTEMLMRQLLKLDGIDAEGEGKVKRKEEVRRVQRLVDNMDVLKGKNLNPFPDNSNPPHLGDNSSTLSVKTQWETFDSGVGSLSPPPPPCSPPPPSSTVATHDREEFE